ncbi:MAG: hypothetical protein KBC08_03085 [Caldisericia bacterium]|nr:hypothetical protein [Caldisericia bacterium]
MRKLVLFSPKTTSILLALVIFLAPFSFGSQNATAGYLDEPNQKILPPFLPSDCNALGGNFSIIGKDKYPSGLVMDCQLCEVTNIKETLNQAMMEYYDPYYGQTQIINLPVKKPSSIPYPYNVLHRDFSWDTFFSGNPQIIKLQDKSFLIGEWCGYSPKLGYAIQQEPLSDGQINLGFIDMDTGNTVSSLKTPATSSITSISKDIFWGEVGKLSGLVDVKTMKVIYSPLYGPPVAFNDEYMASTQEIYSIKERKVTANLSRLGIKANITKIKDGYVDYIFNPVYPTQVKNPKPSLTRVSFDGKLLFRKEFDFKVPVTINDTFVKNLLIIGRTEESHILRYSIRDIDTLEIKHEFQVGENVFTVNNYAVAVSDPTRVATISNLIKIWSTDPIKLVKEIHFPKESIFLDAGGKIFFGYRTDDGQSCFYKLDGNYSPETFTNTIVGTMDQYVIDNGDIVGISLVSKKNEKGIFDTEIKKRSYKIGSKGDYYKELTINTESFMENTGQFKVYDGKIYVCKGFSSIECFDLNDGKLLASIEGIKTAGWETTRTELLLENNVLTIVRYGTQKGLLAYITCIDVQKMTRLYEAHVSAQEKANRLRIKVDCFDSSMIVLNNSSDTYVNYFNGSQPDVIKDSSFIAFENGLLYLYCHNYSGEDDNRLLLFDVKTKNRKYMLFPEGVYQRQAKFDDYHLFGGKLCTLGGDLVQSGLGSWLALPRHGQAFYPILGITEKYIQPSATAYVPSTIAEIPSGLIGKLSPCPSFSVKRTGKGGGDGKGGAGEVDEVSFEFRNTREDERDLVLKGEAYLVSWGDDGKAPVFAKLNEPRHKLGPLLPGMSQEISFKLPEPPLMEHNQKGEGKYFALVVESNGLMDREKSVLSEYDKDPRPLFDGTPVALDQQKAIVVTVWGR